MQIKDLYVGSTYAEIANGKRRVHDVTRIDPCRSQSRTHVHINRSMCYHLETEVIDPNAVDEFSDEEMEEFWRYAESTVALAIMTTIVGNVGRATRIIMEASSDRG